MQPTFDARDAEILERRSTAFQAAMFPRVGDFVRFADGVERRISHIWSPYHGDRGSVQTSDGRWGASFYLGESGAEFSGGLYQGVPPDTLELSDETKEGRFWFFHHDYRTAHNGVNVKVPCRVWLCSEKAPS